MVDTIKIKLNNLVKHRLIYNYSIDSQDNVKYHVNRKGKNDKEEFQYLDKTLLEREVLINGKSKRLTEKVRYHNRFNPSSNYVVVCYVNPLKDCIVYELSLPKYFYGNNVLQIVQDPLERDFMAMDKNTYTLAQQRATFYTRLRKYIIAFFLSEYPALPVDLTDVEILQIDLCFNQVFPDKNQALQYLELQKGIRKNYLRSQTSRFYMNYETSIFYGGSGYKAEIYHKGTEYKKNDRKKHEDINRKAKREVIDIDFLQSLADRTLRYEVSLRNEKLSYIFNEKIFRSTSKAYNLLKELFYKLTSKLALDRLKSFEDIKEMVSFYSNKYIDNQQVFSVVDKIVYYYRNGKNKDYPISEHETFNSFVKFQRDFDRLSNTTRRFFLELTEEESSLAKCDRVTNQGFFETFRYHKFDKEMFQYCFDFLENFMNEFKIESKKQISSYMEIVDSVNKTRAKENERNKILGKKRKSLLDRNRIALLLGALESYSEHELKKLTGMDDRTFRRYRADLKAIGITKNVLDNNRDISAKLDFKAYYIALIGNSKRYIINNTHDKVFS